MNLLLKLYNNSKNPLEDDRTLERIVNAYILKARYGKWSFYDKIEEIGTERKTSTPPPTIEKDKFWSVLFNKWKRNILNNQVKIDTEKYEGHFNELVMVLKGISDISTYSELCDIIEKYPIISKYGVMPREGNLWNYVLSKNVNGTKKKDINPDYRLYINSQASDTYQLIAGFIGECALRKLPYDLKFIEYPEDYKNRADSIVIWADENTLFKYIEILNELKNKIPNIISRCCEPPILTMKLNDWIGFGEEPKEESYTSSKMELLINSIDESMQQWIIENQDSRINYKKTNFSIKQYIATKSVSDQFSLMKGEIQENPKASKTYGVKLDELDKNLFIELCSYVAEQVIPTIKSKNDTVFYRKNGKNISFSFDDSIYDLLYVISHSNTYRNDIFEKIRKNIKLNSKQYGIDTEKFIFNDDYLTRIKKEDEKEK